MVGGFGAAPIAPYTAGRGDALSVSTLLSGTTVTCTICPSRSTSKRTGLAGLFHTVCSTSLQDRSVSPLARTRRSPGRRPARIAGRPGSTMPSRGGARRGRGPGARRRGETGVDEEREHGVHRDAREDHDGPFPHGLAVESARGVDRDVGLPAFDAAGHTLVFEPGHLHVAAEREPGEPVLGLTAPPAENGTPEPDREPQHLDPHGLRREEVAQFVNEDQRAEDHRERDQGQEHAASRARRRASASAASTVSSDAAAVAWCASSTRAMVSAIRPNRIFPSRNSSTATSFAALNAVAAVPPTRAAARPRPYAGYSSAATGSKVRVPAATGSKRRAPASGTRSGWVRA